MPHAPCPNTNLTAIVLAGGQSARMGEDKALLKIQGIPLLERVCTIAQACADTVYIVTPWPERYQNLLLPDCKFIQESPSSPVPSPQYPVPSTQSPIPSPQSPIPNPQPHGPLIGFAQGLAQVHTDWVLLLACDLPRLRVEVLQEWIARLDTVGDDAIAALAHHAKGWEPLCGFYRQRCLPQLLEFINQGGRSFQQWLKQNSVQVLPLLEPEMLFNCNTPEDLWKVN
ncbi:MULTISPECIES: molybdenum cofactor guanylyltransferase [unclassified Tolypothrix]|uniref:molybdenum cofactor guanylyltransferase n=1 Tax=unclassified Tolypothrix TaxID=2649714 RepID=UPI0005EAC804|nr:MULTISPECIES: molybdenum cofactor guanylyltransferase [unclassified Tolypothrix]EKF04036.1 molybdopterin-guanine dinucleotide biosynthesis family protein [Tolypothrix sp. PCC 7601]UYD28095.1 molybdenum cofactor guanylyltransferase [Tolypothrix sp. PCC 7712]UYD36034.1 molybdenum cofactor guanylyltransferase [Tolypothrix sp. PCC 7601]BAY94373.1 molybdopterin-guanine dinucleotide biosynthesis protein A [Microchaete diplosiphon NIES-3275]